MHIVLRQYHVMAGCDYHNEVTATPPPVPAPMIPHVVGHVMQGWGITATALMTDDKVKALGTKIMQRDTDIGNGIIHVPIPPYPPCALLPLIIPTSGSKSYFGPATVLAQGKPIAGAVLIVVKAAVSTIAGLCIISAMETISAKSPISRLRKIVRDNISCSKPVSIGPYTVVALQR